MEENFEKENLEGTPPENLGENVGDTQSEDNWEEIPLEWVREGKSHNYPGGKRGPKPGFNSRKRGRTEEASKGKFVSKGVKREIKLSKEKLEKEREAYMPTQVEYLQKDLSDLALMREHRLEKIGTRTVEDKIAEREELLQILTPEEITYAEFRASGCTSLEAYRMTKYGTIEYKNPKDLAEANRLQSRRRVKALIQMIREEALIITGVDTTEIISKVRRVYEEAIKDKKYDACLKATQQLGDLIGAFAKTPINIDASQKSLTVFNGSSSNPNETKNELQNTLDRFKDILGNNSSIIDN